MWKTAINISCLIVCLQACSFAAAPATTQSTVVGNLEIQRLDSAALKQKRDLRIWLPADYSKDSKTGFDVLYMHDGQNLFDVATSAFGHEWQIDETLTRLIADKTIPPLIVVGIDNSPTDRIGEYTYAPDAKHGGGRAATYVDFLLNEVKPFLEKNYRVQTGPKHTFLGGSSVGGLVSLEIALRHPGVFGGVMAMSPSLWWRGNPIVDSLKSDAAPLIHTRLWNRRGHQRRGQCSRKRPRSLIDAAAGCGPDRCAYRSPHDDR